MTTQACTVSQKSLTKNFKVWKERKLDKYRENTLEKLVRNPTIQYITEIFDEKFHHSKYGKKENWSNKGRISRRKLVRNPTIQYIIINLLTKYDDSSLHNFTEIFDEKFHHSKYGKKEIGQRQGRISRRKLVRNPTIQHVIINLYTKYYISSLHSFTEIFDEEVLRNYGRTDVRTDVNQYTPIFSKRGYNYFEIPA